MEAVLGALGSGGTASIGSSVGSAFGLSPEMIKVLGGGEKDAMAAMQGAMKSAQPTAPQMPRATPRPVDMNQLLAMLKDRQQLGT